MLKDLQSLLVLQDRDLILQQIKTQMTEVPKDLSLAQNRLIEDETELKKAKSDLKQIELEAANIRLSRRTREATLEKLKVQQFETKKNDEFNAFGAEIKRYQADIDELETEELTLLEKIDQQKELIKKAAQQFEQCTEQFKQTKQTLEEKAKNLIEQFKKAADKRSSAAAEIEENLLQQYQRILNSKENFAIAEVSKGICRGCNIKLIASTIGILRADQEITYCENCGRMLFEPS